jgi:hypothetical protein
MALNPKNRTEQEKKSYRRVSTRKVPRVIAAKAYQRKVSGGTAGTPHSLENTNRLEFGNLTIADEVDAQLKQTDAALHGS